MGRCRLTAPLAAPAAVMLAAAASCATDQCLDNQNSLPYAAFYSIDEVPQPIAVDSLSIYGLGAPADSMLVDSAASVSTVYLPFRIDRGNTTYVIDYLEKELSRRGIKDTVAFSYDIKPYFVSAACGAVYIYEDVKAHHTTNLIDSVAIPYGKIDNRALENIIIYFKVITDPGETPTD